MKNNQSQPHGEYLRDKFTNPEVAVSLAQLREAQGWTQSDLEAQSGVPQETISRIERGRIPAVPTLKRLAKALNACVLILPDEQVLFQRDRKQMEQELQIDLRQWHTPQSLGELKPRVPPPPGMTAMQAIRGQWPCDETDTDEDILASLKAMG